MAGRLLSALAPLLPLSDEQAMARVKTDGDPQAFARLVERWQGPLQRLALRMTGDSHRAEDIAQEAFARVFARRKDYVPAGKFSTYLWRVALNLCHDERRRAQRRPEFSLDALDDDEDGGPGLGERLAADGPVPDAATDGRERAEAVRHALGRLAEPYRAVVVLRHYEGLKFREIAGVLAIPEGTVKSRMAEALAQLNALLNPVLADDAPAPNRLKESLIL